jgi:hypothetical protein
MTRPMARLLSVPIAFLFSTLTALSAFAVRTEFIARFEGKRLAESQVCFFPAARDDGFFEKFLSSTDIRCLSADAVIEMPVGNWNAFVETGDSYTSTHPTFQFGSEESAAARRGYRPVTMDLRRAARIRFDVQALGNGIRPVVYFPNLGTEEPASVRPLVPGRDFILVPASTPVVPLLVRGTEIVAVGEVATLEPGALADAKFHQRRDGRRDLVALLRMPGEMDDEDPADDPLDVHLESGLTLLQPIVPTRKGLGNERSLTIFRDVPEGSATLVVGGKGWSSHRLPIPPSSDSVQVLRDGIAIGRRAELEIGWSLPEAALVRPCRKEHETPSAPKDRAAIGIERCSDDKRCELVAEIPIEGAGIHGRVHRSDRLGTLPSQSAAFPFRLGLTRRRIAARSCDRCRSRTPGRLCSRFGERGPSRNRRGHRLRDGERDRGLERTIRRAAVGPSGTADGLRVSLRRQRGVHRRSERAASRRIGLRHRRSRYETDGRSLRLAERDTDRGGIDHRSRAGGERRRRVVLSRRRTDRGLRQDDPATHHAGGVATDLCASPRLRGTLRRCLRAGAR